MRVMNVSQNVSLAAYSGMGLGGLAAYLTEVHSRMEVLEALSWAQSQNVPAIMIGIGSNIVWRDEGFPGLVLVDKIQGYEQYDAVSYTHLRAHETGRNLVCRLLLEK